MNEDVNNLEKEVATLKVNIEPKLFKQKVKIIKHENEELRADIKFLMGKYSELVENLTNQENQYGFHFKFFRHSNFLTREMFSYFFARMWPLHIVKPSEEICL